MSNQITRILFRSFVFLALQLFIIDQIVLGHFLGPQIYPAIILLLPLEIAPWIVLLISFVLGGFIDIFSQTGGLHAGATTLMAFARPFVLKLVLPKTGYDDDNSIEPQVVEWQRFLMYISLLLFLHHIYLFWVEAGRIGEFLSALLNTFVTGIQSVTVIMLLLFTKRKKA